MVQAILSNQLPTPTNIGAATSTEVDELKASVNDLDNKIKTEVASKSNSITQTISPASWVGDAAPYSYVFQSESIKADSNGVISLSNEATQEQREAARAAMMSCGAQSNGSITVYADGKDKPTVDIPVTLILIG